MILATFYKDKDKDKQPVLDLNIFVMKTKKIFGILPLLLMKTRIKRLMVDYVNFLMKTKVVALVKGSLSIV
jgi:hypothetical protein